MKFKTGDTVMITGGKDKGKRGKIEKVLPKAQKVLVLGLNVYKRHVKKQSEKGVSGIIDVARPIPVGRIAVLCPKCSGPTRVGYTDDGHDKKRVCRKCSSVL